MLSQKLGKKSGSLCVPLACTLKHSEKGSHVSLDSDDHEHRKHFLEVNNSQILLEICFSFLYHSATSGIQQQKHFRQKKILQKLRVISERNTAKSAWYFERGQLRN